MARRRFRIFIVRRRLAEGCVFQNTKEAKAMFEDIKREPIFGLRNAVPDRPILLMNTYPSYRMAEALILPELFSPAVCIGIARRLPNGRGYRVFACVENKRLLQQTVEGVLPFSYWRKYADVYRTLEMIQRHGVYGKMGAPTPRDYTPEELSKYLKELRSKLFTNAERDYTNLWSPESPP